MEERALVGQFKISLQIKHPRESGVLCMRGSLYRKCIETDNIKNAIKEIRSHSGSKTSGPDGITVHTKISIDEAVRQVKLRLRRFKRVHSRKIDIPKKDGKTRTLTVMNLYDRYAQQAIYRVINPLIEPKMSKHSYGFRSGISTKVPASKIASFIQNCENTYTVEIDFEKCFDNIPLEKAIGKLKELGIRDYLLLKTIKHLMYISKEYSGIGLGQGTILGPLLCNCYLDKLDRFMEKEFSIDVRDKAKARDYAKHKTEWISWNLKRNKKIACKYYRFADDTIILTSVKEEQDYIWNKLIEFIETEMEINVNLAKSKKRRNKTDFLGFHFMKSVKSGGAKSIWITVKDEREITRTAKQKLRQGDRLSLVNFKKYFLGVLNYFDIVNSMRKLLPKIENLLYYTSRRTGIIKLANKGQNRVFVDKNGRELDIWQLRRDTKTSTKTYNTGQAWIAERENLKVATNDNHEWYIYKWLLFTKQRGRDKITGKLLKATDCQIHHIKPRNKGGLDIPENLILISKDTHERLHYGGELPKIAEKYRKHLSA